MGDSLVMVVDDDPDIREGLQDLLVDDGFKVAIAKHGRDALDQLEGGVHPGLIVLDLMMPVMDGYEFYRRWAEDPELKRIPLLVVSASQVREAHKQFAEATAFMSKPLEVDRFLAVVEKSVFKPS
ncbi:MAG: response regulator [Myxococcaceae bacterium]|nr:response regulator [Myxococcaceae bacterium]